MTEWITVKPLTCIEPPKHYTVVATHPGRCVGLHMEKRACAYRWSGANTTRAHDESLTRQCPLFYLVPHRGLLDAATPVLHLGSTSRLSNALLDTSARVLVALGVQQVIWVSDQTPASQPFDLDIEAVVRLARLLGAASGVLPGLLIYSARVEGVGNALDSAE